MPGHRPEIRVRDLRAAARAGCLSLRTRSERLPRAAARGGIKRGDPDRRCRRSRENDRSALRGAPSIGGTNRQRMHRRWRQPARSASVNHRRFAAPWHRFGDMPICRIFEFYGRGYGKRQLTAHGGSRTLVGDEWPLEQKIIEPLATSRHFHIRRIQGRKPDDTHAR